MIARSSALTSVGLRYTDERGSASNRHCWDIGSAEFMRSTIARRSARPRIKSGGFVPKRSYEGGRLILRLRIAASTTGERQQWQACTIVSDSRRRFTRRSSSARRAGSLPSLVLIAIGRAFIGSAVAIWLI